MVQTTIEDFLKWDENKRNNNGSSSWKKIQTKDEVLAELMAEHIALRKSLGEL